MRAPGIAVLLGVAIVAVSAHAQTGAAIHGIVVDQNGRPVESAQISLTPGARRALSFDDGTFDIPGLKAGDYVLSARRIGYQPASRSVTLRDATVAVTIMLVAIPAQLDSIHIRERLSGIRYSAVVLDQNDAPIAGAEVVAMGINSNLTTDSLGRFTVPGLSRGTLIVRIRKIGYAAYFDSFRILAERADTIRMPRLAQSLTPVEVNEQSGFGMDFWAFRDLESRQAWKGAMAGAISREELAQQGTVNLCDALPGTASGNRLNLHFDRKCKIFPEGIRTVLIDGVRCVHTLLSDFDADQVELVEYFPNRRGSDAPSNRFFPKLPPRHLSQDSDISGTLASRDCDTPPPIYVVWTRKNTAHPVSAAVLAEARQLQEGAAQVADVPRSIVGTVFDNVANQPLSGAHVHLADLRRDVVADSLGGFRFDNVGTGVHAVWADHPTLDLLGFNALGARVDATAQAVTTLNLAIPSFVTLWRVACGSDMTARDGTGFVFGRVLSSTPSRGTQGTSIDIAWRAVADERPSGPVAETRRTVHADSTGSYAACGVPDRQIVTISASDSGVSTVPVSFRVSAARITVSGVGGEWRTSATGGFVVRGIPAGTHVVAVNTIGFVRERRMVELAAQDSATLDLSMTRLLTTLPTVTVEERRRFDALKSDLESRRRMGFGYRADSAALARLPGVIEAFNFPGVRTRSSQGRWFIYMNGVYTMTSKNGSGITMTCAPTIWIDGSIADMDYLTEITKDEIGVIEVYTSAAGAPLQFTGTRTNCGVVLVWRKRFLNP